VQVEVLNGNGIQGAAARAASDLSNRGFHVTGSTNGPNSNYTDSVIEYSTPSDMAEVNTLKAQLSSVQVQQDPNLTPGTVTLIIGSTFKGLSSSTGSSSSSSSSSSSPSVTNNLSKTYGGINATANICDNKQAFVGPDNPADGT
jgi:LytR cell envelope-related transcriptional attenuator